MSSYLPKHRNYYQSHRDQIMAKESEKKRWLDYYERNKEAIKERRDARKARGCGPPPVIADATPFSILNLMAEP
jgi:hypothetical protein